MATLSLRISIPEKNATKMMQFDPNTSVYDSCRIIREKLTEVSGMEKTRDYGLFLSDEDTRKGVWLEASRNLDYYILRNGDLLEYKRKLRTLRVRMLDGTLKTILVDDSQPISNLMVVICTKIGITNHDEYSLVRDVIEEDFENNKSLNFGTLTLKKRREEKAEKDVKMDQLRKKLKTDDEVNWIDPSKTLREQGIDESETVLLRRKFFYSDQNIDSRDPVQLSLLYVQARDAIIDGTHPIVLDQACIFAGIQCQIQFGDYKEDKHKSGFLDLKEFLPQSYLKIKNIEKKIFFEHKKHFGLSELESKVLYTKTARSLNTYGVTFFLVKEKMKGKNKLVPRLLGVTKDSVLRLDEKTKEILKTWPLTTVRRWGASPNTFTLDFGDYSDQYYSVQATQAEQILQLISGYIDIILKKQKAKDHFGIEGDEGSTMVEDSISPLKATIMQHESGPVGTGNVDSVSLAIPGVIRTGIDGARLYGTGHISGVQYTTISGQVNVAHAPSMPRQNLLNAVSRVGEASHEVLSTISEEDSSNKKLLDLILSLAKAIANTTAALVLKAKRIAATCEDSINQNLVISAATNCALATSQLVACAKVIAPTLNLLICQTQLINATREVTKAVENLVKVCNEMCPDENLLKELSIAASDVSRTLNELLNHIKSSTSKTTTVETVQSGAIETILSAADKLFASSGDAGEMVRQARVVGQATAQLIQSIKGVAEKQADSAQQQRLLAAAKILADATSKMVEAARQCASSPLDANMQIKLREAVEELREVTTVAATPALRRNLICRLGNSAKQAASLATQCVAASSGAGSYNTNITSQTELNIESRKLMQLIPNLVSGVKGTFSHPDNPAMQLSLINASEQFLLAGSAVVKASKAVLPTITEQAPALQLNTCSQQFGWALTDLRSAVSRARNICTGLELDTAEELLHMLKKDVMEFHIAVETNSLKPLPEETAESTSLKLGSVSKAVGFAMAQLLSAATQNNENYTRNFVTEISEALKELVSVVRGVTATIIQPDIQSTLLRTIDEILDKSLKLITLTRCILKTPNHLDITFNLTSVIKEISLLLNNCVSCLPGQRDMEKAINTIENISKMLLSKPNPSTNKKYREVQSDLSSAAANLNNVSSKILSSICLPAELAISSAEFTDAFNCLIQVGIEMSVQSTDKTQSQVTASLKNISVSCIEFLSAAKSVAAYPNTPNARNHLSSTARAITDSINHLLDICTSALPGQIECDNSIRNIQSMLPLLDDPSEPISDASYFECLETVMEKSKNLGDEMTGIANYAKKCQHQDFSIAIKGAASSICGLVEAAAQAAYLAGISDPSSDSGKPGLIDQAHLFRSAQNIQSSCQALGNPTTSQQQILSAATVIAKYTSALCNACRLASSKTSNPVAKRHFVESAKDVANCTAVLVKEIKNLDLSYTDKNKDKCVAATKPLLEAVDNLCIFASSPEFSNQPAKISAAAKNTQEPITSAGKFIIHGSSAMILAAKSLSVTPKDPPTWQLLANHSKKVSDSIKALVTSIRDKAPGQKECDYAIHKLTMKIRDIDTASLNAISQTLTSRKDNTIQGFIDQMDNSISELRERLESLRNAAKYEAENIGHSLTQIILFCEPLVSGGIGSASHMVQSKPEMLMLDQTKTVVESILQLVYAVKESGGNPKAVNLHTEVDDSIDSTKESLQELQNTLESISTSNGVVTGLIETITRAIVKLDEQGISVKDSIDTFVDYQTRMVTVAKEIAKISQEIISKINTDVTKMCPLAMDLSHKFTQLAQDAFGASAITSNADVSLKLRVGVQELGKACTDIVRTAGICQISPTDSYLKHEISDCAKIICEKVSEVLAALQAGSRGTQACINAASTVSGIIGDLDTTIMFATAGTLHAENENETFADHRENILKTAKALVEDTKTLVAGAASSQEQLAVAAQNAVSTIVQLAEVVKCGAASLGNNNPEAQVMLINAVRDVASALGDLVQATKAASGKLINDPSMAHLKDSAKIMVTNVTSLLKTVKVVEDEHNRGTRALEATIEAISQEIRTLNTIDNQANRATPNDLLRCTKNITISTSKAVSAGNSGKQDDIIAAANMGRRSISDMLLICKGTMQNCAESLDIKERIFQTGHNVAMSYKELLQVILQILAKSSECKNLLLPISRKIAQNVTELVAVAEILKENNCEDPSDPTVIAENELLGAAASIDAAAKKLANLQPRRNIQETKDDMNFDEMILEAAKSIAAATSALIKAASGAQRELITLGKVSRSPLTSSDDGQWSEGLISAARMVAAATHSLVDSANSLVQGCSSEEKLISSAKQVASSTAQLLVACKVKADPESDSTKRLQAAGNAVKRATDNLVRAGQQAIKHEEERSLVLNRRIVGGIAQEINARSEVLRIERELEEARGRLTAIRQAKYRNRNDSSDNYIDIDSNNYDTASCSEKKFDIFIDQQKDETQNVFNAKYNKESIVSPENTYSTQSTTGHMQKNQVSTIKSIPNACAASILNIPDCLSNNQFESVSTCLIRKGNLYKINDENLIPVSDFSTTNHIDGYFKDVHQSSFSSIHHNSLEEYQSMEDFLNTNIKHDNMKNKNDIEMSSTDNEYTVKSFDGIQNASSEKACTISKYESLSNDEHFNSDELFQANDLFQPQSVKNNEVHKTIEMSKFNEVTSKH